jgi:hypothetical protein
MPDNIKCEGVSEDIEGLSGVTTDWYGGSDIVSFEEAAATEIDLKDELDNSVVDENKYGSASRHASGLPPCIRRKTISNG